MPTAGPPVGQLRTYAGAAALVGKTPAVITRAVQAGTLRAWRTADGKCGLIWDRDLRAWAKSAAPGRPKLISNRD